MPHSTARDCQALSVLRVSVSAVLGYSKCSVSCQFGDGDKRTVRPFYKEQKSALCLRPLRVWHRLPLVAQVGAAGFPAPTAPQGCLLRAPSSHTTQSKEEAVQERTAVKPRGAAGGHRYLCHSRCAWSSPRIPLGKQPPRAQRLPGWWGPPWPPSFLLPGNTRDTQW